MSSERQQEQNSQPLEKNAQDRDVKLGGVTISYDYSMEEDPRSQAGFLSLEELVHRLEQYKSRSGR